MLFANPASLRMPAAAEALPGRDEPLPVPPGHFVHGRPIAPPFPEGTRSKSHSLQEAQLGVVYLALKSQAPILPVGVTGTQKTRAWRMPVPLCRLTASIGPPFTLPTIEGRIPRPVMQGMLRTVMERVALQLPPEFRGVYDPTGNPNKE